MASPAFSKTMSYILRYHCDEFNLEKDELGYVDTQEFLEAIRRNFPKATMKDIRYWVKRDNGRGRKRFEFNDESESKIRACYKYDD